MSEEITGADGAVTPPAVIPPEGEGGTGEGETPNPNGTPPSPAAGSGFQDRIDELTRKRREAERDAEYWRGRAEATPPSTSEPKEEQGLDPDDFDTNADYLKAVTTQIRDDIKTTNALERKNEQNAVIQTEVAKQYQEARVKHTDFDEVALSPSVQITQSMFDAAMGKSLGDVLYFLGSNKAEASRIASLSPTQQIKEIGKIETKLVLKTPGQTNAPNPPATVGGGGSTTTKSEKEMTRSELHAKWNATRRAKAGV